MNKIDKCALSIWTFRWPLIGSAFLISPVLIDDVASLFDPERSPDKIILFALPISILWLVVAHTGFKRMWIAQLLLLPLYATVGVDLFLINNYGIRLTSSTISLVLENLHHSADFARTEAFSLFSFAGFCVLLYAGVLSGTRNLQVHSGRPLIASVAALAMVYGGVVAYRAAMAGDLASGVADVISHDRNSPFGVFPQSYVAYKIYVDAEEHRRRSESFRFHASQVLPSQDPEIYVLVVGESSRRDRWSIYGYSRATTPKLAARRDIIPFQDMITQAALTQISVPLMLTRNTVEQPDLWANEKSFISAFKEAGFKTYWLSTQQRDQFTGAINRYSAEADHSNFRERRHDGVLVDQLKAELGKAGQATKLLIVIHTQGSHFVYRDRYPWDYALFRGSRLAMLDEYDNSVAYTDFVLTEIIGVLEATSAKAALLYCSDHGENLRDDERQLLGHPHNNEYDMPIPAFLWVSNEWQKTHPEKFAAATENATKKLSTRIVFSTMVDLANLRIPGHDLSETSILRREYVPQARKFIKNDRIADFDVWIARKFAKNQDLVRP